MKNDIDHTIMLSASYAKSLLNFRKKLIERLIELNKNVVVVAPNIENNLRLKLENMGCIVTSVSLRRNKIDVLSDIIYFVQIYLLLRKYKPALLLSYTSKPNIYGAFAAYLANVRSISIITGLGINFSQHQKIFSCSIFKILFKKALSLNSFVICQNNDDIKELQFNGFLRNLDKVGLVNGSGVDVQFFDERSLPETTRFLMVARLLKSKGIFEYLEAAKSTVMKGYDVTFTLIGPNDYGPDAVDRNYIEQKYAEYVTILDEVEDVRPIIENSSVLVLPSYREGTPRSVLEAMAMGRAIVTTDVPGCRETVIDAENGFLVKEKSVDSLVDALTLLCENPKFIPMMGKRSRTIVEKKYEVNFVTDQYVNHIMQNLELY